MCQILHLVLRIRGEHDGRDLEADFVGRDVGNDQMSHGQWRCSLPRVHVWGDSSGGFPKPN